VFGGSDGTNGLGGGGGGYRYWGGPRGGSGVVIVKYPTVGGGIGTAPTYSVTSVSPASGNTAKVGDSVVVTITADSLETGLTASGTPTVNGVNSSFTEIGSGVYHITYVVVEDDTDVLDANALAISIKLKDTAGNIGTEITTIASGTAPGIDAHTPVISTITSDATASGVLNIGQTIIFTATPASTEDGALVVGSYNGQVLSWSTADSGVTYTATYIVTQGDTDQNSALQISGVILSDAAGNPSAAKAGTDIAKTIDANVPVITAFTMPATANFFTVSISSFTGTDTGGSGVAYYLVNETGTTPLVGDAGWETPAPTSHTFSGEGLNTLYAWIKDTAGNISSRSSASVTITLNTAPSATITTPGTWNKGDVTINYNIIDAESNTINISQVDHDRGIEYSVNSTNGVNGTWVDATEKTGSPSEGLTGLTSSPTGADHVFVWASATDLGTTEDSTVYIRVRPNDGTVNADAWATTTAFGIDNV
ncbi:MAG: hypothetical protein NTW11_00535, partial [Candidatus Staskawiczbacteria bacterium]|nr:hypothetical protein [Candidatus Staskawiczbacteria bacterium]